MASPRIVLALAVGLIVANPAMAFDTGPHFDMTEDVMRAEGFSDNAIRTAQAANFLIDFHEFIGNEKFARALDPGCRAQLAAVLKIGDSLQHFDDLETPTEVSHRWDSMIEGTKKVAGLYEKLPTGPDILGLVALLGASLHNVQDFYAHSNWVEFVGKGTLAPYGTSPTWLSVDRATREALNVYTRRKKDNPPRTHGEWNTVGLTKDWSGRPLHREAYTCAWFATRQWVRLFRSFVGPQTWAKMQAFQQASFDPQWDWVHARKISSYGGHWNGNGGPVELKDVISDEAAATSPDLLLQAVLSYLGYNIFDLSKIVSLERPCLTKNRTLLRLKIESLLKTWGTWESKTPMNPAMPSAAPESVSFVQVRVEDIVAIDPDDGFRGGEQDWFARGIIGGQRFWTGLIDEHNDFHFQKPYWPWTVIKAIQPSEAVTSFVVRVRTGSDEDADTDDEIYLWVNDRKLRFPYDPVEDDFEIGATYDYSFDLQRMRVGDIRRIRIEKEGTDGWQLGGIEIAVNDRVIYRKEGINAWLDNPKLAWEATDFRPGAGSGEIPLHVDLRELDYKDEDSADINPRPNAKSLFFDYALDTGKVRGDIAANPSTTAGTEKGDKARIRIKVEPLGASSRSAPLTSAKSTGP